MKQDIKYITIDDAIDRHIYSHPICYLNCKKKYQPSCCDASHVYGFR